MSFPSTLDDFTDSASTEVLSVAGGVGLAAMLNQLNTAIEAIEAKVGVTDSAVTTSLDYLVKSTSSSNPGHKHTLASGATDVTASAAELNVLDSIPATLTATELGYVDGVTSAIQTQMDLKAPLASPAFTGTVTIPDEAYGTTWNGVLVPTTKNAVYDANFFEDNFMRAIKALGSSNLFRTTGFNFNTTTLPLADGVVRFGAVYIDRAATITGIKFYQVTQGDYTADNNNYVALYSYSGGTLTQVAISANNGDVWKATSSSWNTVAFSSPYVASPGIYFTGVLYNSSAQTTAPVLGVSGAISGATFDLTNSAMLFGSLAAQASLPASQAISGLTLVGGSPALFLY